MRIFCCKAPRIPLKGSAPGKTLNLRTRKPWASWEVVSVLTLLWFSVSCFFIWMWLLLSHIFHFLLQYSLKSGLYNWIFVYVTFDTIIWDANSQTNCRLWISTHILTLWLADFESGVQNLFNHIHQMVPCLSPAAGVVKLGLPSSLHSAFHIPLSLGFASNHPRHFSPRTSMLIYQTILPLVKVYCHFSYSPSRKYMC